MSAKGDIKGLIGALKYQPGHRGIQRDEDRVIPRRAAQALERYRDPRAVEALAAVVRGEIDERDPDPELRLFAASSLGQMGDPRAVDALVLTLQDRYSGIRSAAANALANLAQDGVRENRAIGPLVSRLTDTQPDVRTQVAQALELLGWQPEATPAGAAYCIEREKWDELAAIGELALEPLSRVIEELVAERVPLADHNRITDRRDWKKPPSVPSLTRKRENTIRLLGEMGGEQAFGLLVDVLRVVRADLSSLGIEGDLNLRSAVIDALARITTRDVEPLIPLLSDGAVPSIWADLDAADMRVLVVDVLERNGGEQARGALAAALNHKDVRVQQSAALALARLEDGRAAQKLLDVIESRGDDKEWRPERDRERESAVSALGKLGAAQAIPSLVRMLSEDRGSKAQVRAAEVLAESGWKPGQDEIGVRYHLIRNQLEDCLEIGAPAIAPLIALLESRGGASKKAAEVLEMMGARAVEPLCTALKQAAVKAKAFTPTPLPPGASIPGENWYWQSAGFRVDACRVLGRIGDAKAVQALTWVSLNDSFVVDLLAGEEIAARDDSWPVRDEALGALGLIAQQTVA